LSAGQALSPQRPRPRDKGDGKGKANVAKGDGSSKADNEGKTQIALPSSKARKEVLKSSQRPLLNPKGK